MKEKGLVFKLAMLVVGRHAACGPLDGKWLYMSMFL